MKIGSPFCELVSCAEFKHEVFANGTHQDNPVHSIDPLSAHSPEPNVAVDNILVNSDGDVVKNRRVRRPILHILDTERDRRVGGSTMRSQSVVVALRKPLATRKSLGSSNLLCR